MLSIKPVLVSDVLTVTEKLAKLTSCLDADLIDPAADENYAVTWALEQGQLDAAERLLLDARVDPFGAFGLCVEKGYIDLVKRLLKDDRVDPSAENNGAICGAARGGILAVVNCLLQDERVDPTVYDNHPIQIAAGNGHLDIVNRLLEDDRVDPSDDSNLAIRRAAEKGHLNIVKRLLEDKRVDLDVAIAEAAAGTGARQVLMSQKIQQTVAAAPTETKHSVDVNVHVYIHHDKE